MRVIANRAPGGASGIAVEPRSRPDQGRNGKKELMQQVLSQQATTAPEYFDNGTV